MIFALATAALSATTVYSQATSLSPETIATAGLQQLSSECRSAILSLAVSPLTECLGVSALAPAISANASLVPILDNWMETICAAEPCDQELLDSTAQNFSSACNDDFAKYDVSGTDIQDIVGMYPLVRELVCLKTTEPFVSNSTMNSTMTETNSTSANSTEEDTFCVTSLLTEVSEYLGMNLTVNSIFDLVLGSDTEGRQALTELPPTALCQDCIYAGAGLIEQQYPGIWNETITGNFTIGGFLNSTCVNETFPEIDMESNNTITLPETVYPSAENSTYAYPIMYMNGTTNETYTPSETVQQPPSIPFLNFPPADVEGGVPAPTAVTSLTGPDATSSEVAPVTSVTDMASSAIATATAPVVSAVSVASSVAPAAPTKRDVTAAKRRWVGQQ